MYLRELREVRRSPKHQPNFHHRTTTYSFNTSFIRACSIISRFSPCPSHLLPKFRSISCTGGTSESRKVCRFYVVVHLRLDCSTQNYRNSGNVRRASPSLVSLGISQAPQMMISLPQCRIVFRKDREAQDAMLCQIICSPFSAQHTQD
jgi:hypothetical protein